MSGQNSLPMPWYLMRHAGNGLDFEDRLGLGAKGDRCLEGVLNAMIAKKLEEVGRILVDNNVGVGNVYAKTVGQKLFLIL